MTKQIPCEQCFSKPWVSCNSSGRDVLCCSQSLAKFGTKDGKSIVLLIIWWTELAISWMLSIMFFSVSTLPILELVLIRILILSTYLLQSKTRAVDYFVKLSVPSGNEEAGHNSIYTKNNGCMLNLQL